MKSLVYGFGINDADYATGPVVNGKQVICPIYRTWTSVLQRCYSRRLHKSHPTYIGCSVHPEWRYFIAFRDWMLRQDYEGKEIDKDLLFQGNKVYSPSTCVFVSPLVNTFILDGGFVPGKHLIGTHLISPNRFRARIHKRRKYSVHLGYFTSEIEAHAAWAYAKRDLAYELATEQTDERVAQALRKFGDRVVANADAKRQAG